MDAQITAAIIGPLTGALAGGVASFVVNECVDKWRIRRVTAGVGLKPESRAGSRVTARVKNDSNYCIHGAVAYITLHHDLDDVLTPPKRCSAFISPTHKRKLQEDRLCWAVAAPERNPLSVNIFPGERQMLDIADFGESSEWLEIPSELGWSSNQTEAETTKEDTRRISSRIFLRSGKSCAGTIKIVSADTRARVFKIEINPLDRSQPLRLVS